MCGIAGVSCFSDYDPRSYIAMSMMALQMEKRGSKSWGWTDGDQIVKSLGPISDGWNSTLGQEFPKTALHTRHPTTGSLVKENSHPFKIGDIVGMHNGIVHNHAELQTKYSRTCAVDSEHIFHHINEGLSLNEIKAYGAIVYWKDDVVHLGRFNNGDMCLARTETAWVFASTKTAVEQAVRVAGLKKNVVYMTLAEGRLYRLNGSQLEVAGDLNFGSYSSSYGTWQNASKSITAVTSWKDNKFPGTGQYYSGGVSGYRGTVPVTAQVNPNQHLLPKVIDATTDGQKVKSALDVTQRIIEIALAKALEVEATITPAKTTKPKGEWIWQCYACGKDVLGAFHVTDESNIVCDLCAVNMLDRLLTIRELYHIPQDIMSPSAMGVDDKDSDGNFTCDACTSAFHEHDSVFLTEFNDFLCLDCFIGGEGEQEIDTADDDEAFEDMSAEDNKDLPQGEAIYAEYEDKDIKVETLPDFSVKVTHKKDGTIDLYPPQTDPSKFLDKNLSEDLEITAS